MRSDEELNQLRRALHVIRSRDWGPGRVGTDEDDRAVELELQAFLANGTAPGVLFAEAMAVVAAKRAERGVVVGRQRRVAGLGRFGVGYVAEKGRRVWWWQR